MNIKINYNKIKHIIKAGNKPTLAQKQRHRDYVKYMNSHGHNEMLYPFVDTCRMPRPKGKIYRDSQTEENIDKNMSENNFQLKKSKKY